MRLLALFWRPPGRLAHGSINASDRDLIEGKLARRLGKDRLHDDDTLHAARRALRPARRSIRKHRHPAPAHRLRLIEQRNDCSGGIRVADSVIRTVVADRVHVEGSDASVFRKANFHAALESRPRAADEMLFLAADAHHHW